MQVPHVSDDANKHCWYLLEFQKAAKWAREKAVPQWGYIYPPVLGMDKIASAIEVEK